MDESRPGDQSKRARKNAQSLEIGRGIWEEYRDIACMCRDAVRKAKEWLELNMVRDAKNTPKGFYRYICQKRMSKLNVILLLMNMTSKLGTTNQVLNFLPHHSSPHLLSEARQEPSLSHCKRRSGLRPPEEPAETSISLWDLTRCALKS